MIIKRERIADGYSNEVEVLIDKNTMGGTGSFKQMMAPEYYRVGDMYKGVPMTPALPVLRHPPLARPEALSECAAALAGAAGCEELAARDSAYLIAHQEYHRLSGLYPLSLYWLLIYLIARYDLYPPSRRHYDLDNLVAMLKPSRRRMPGAEHQRPADP